MNVHKLPIISLLLMIGLITIGVVKDSQGMPPLDIKKAPVPPDYSKHEAWLSKPVNTTATVDVFYVYPTVLFDDVNWIMDPANKEMCAAAKYSLDTQAAVFDGLANVYAPIYRQMNLAGLGLDESESEKLQTFGYGDVLRALKYYLKYENDGRPFFLAAHSQGSMILANLMLDNWGTLGFEDKLIAALLLGWSLTPEDLASNPAVKMCDISSRTRCVISYNTMAEGRQAVAPTLKKGALTVNPLSWEMDGKFVGANKNLGAVFFNADAEPTNYPNFTSAQIVDGGLVVQPKNVELVTVDGGHFPEGIYHAFDYSLFFENIRANIKERIDAY